MLPDTLMEDTPSVDDLGLNAPTGAWCSLTAAIQSLWVSHIVSQCTYRCVVLPDPYTNSSTTLFAFVSMHLQVRGAP